MTGLEGSHVSYESDAEPINMGYPPRFRGTAFENAWIDTARHLGRFGDA